MSEDTKIYFMRDNFSFRRIPHDMASAMEILREEVTGNVNGAYGMLCAKHAGAGMPDNVHANGAENWADFEKKARKFIAAAMS